MTYRDTSFMEFVCEYFLGEPTYRAAPGDSWWHCPFHRDDNPSFHTLPATEDYPEYWKCWGCRTGGDVWEFFRGLRDRVYIPPGEVVGSYYREHQELHARLRKEWSRARKRAPAWVRNLNGPGAPPLVDPLTIPLRKRLRRLRGVTYNAGSLAVQLLEAGEDRLAAVHAVDHMMFVHKELSAILGGRR